MMRNFRYPEKSNVTYVDYRETIVYSHQNHRTIPNQSGRKEKKIIRGGDNINSNKCARVRKQHIKPRNQMMMNTCFLDGRDYSLSNNIHTLSCDKINEKNLLEFVKLEPPQQLLIQNVRGSPVSHGSTQQPESSRLSPPANIGDDSSKLDPYFNNMCDDLTPIDEFLFPAFYGHDLNDVSSPLSVTPVYSSVISPKSSQLFPPSPPIFGIKESLSNQQFSNSNNKLPSPTSSVSSSDRESFGEQEQQGNIFFGEDYHGEYTEFHDPIHTPPPKNEIEPILDKPFYSNKTNNSMGMDYVPSMNYNPQDTVVFNGGNMFFNNRFTPNIPQPNIQPRANIISEFEEMDTVVSIPTQECSVLTKKALNSKVRVIEKYFRMLDFSLPSLPWASQKGIVLENCYDGISVIKIQLGEGNLSDGDVHVDFKIFRCAWIRGNKPNPLKLVISEDREELTGPKTNPSIFKPCVKKSKRRKKKKNQQQPNVGGQGCRNTIIVCDNPRQEITRDGMLILEYRLNNFKCSKAKGINLLQLSVFLRGKFFLQTGYFFKKDNRTEAKYHQLNEIRSLKLDNIGNQIRNIDNSSLDYSNFCFDINNSYSNDNYNFTCHFGVPEFVRRSKETVEMKRLFIIISTFLKYMNSLLPEIEKLEKHNKSENEENEEKKEKEIEEEEEEEEECEEELEKTDDSDSESFEAKKAMLSVYLKIVKTGVSLYKKLKLEAYGGE